MLQGNIKRNVLKARSVDEETQWVGLGAGMRTRAAGAQVWKNSLSHDQDFLG